MKSKFEKAFKEQAYNAVPDKWEEIKEKTGVCVPRTENKVARFNVRAIASVAASAAVVIVAVSVAVGLGGRGNTPEKGGITATEGNGAAYAVSDASGSADKAETTVITYKDSEGNVHTTIAAVTQNGSGQSAASGDAETAKDAQGNAKTTDARNQTQPSTNAPGGAPPAASTAPFTEQTAAVSTTAVEMYKETDWDKRTMQEKFPAVRFDSAGSLGKEYSAAFRGSEYISRPATLLYSGYTLRNINPKTDKEETVNADIYVLQGFDRALAVGVRFPGEEHIHPYINVQYTPQTLGEFMNAADVKNSVHFGNIRLYKDGTFPVNAQNKADIFRYLLSDGSLPNTNATDWPTGNRVTMSISLAELGQNNKAMYVYENGYIATNLIGRVYVFNVGKDNVATFLKNSYNVTFDDLAQVNTAATSTTSKQTPTVSNPYNNDLFPKSQTDTTAVSAPRTVPE